MGSWLPVGKFFGVEFRIDSMLLLLAVVYAFEGFDAGGFQGVLDALTFFVFLLVSIVLHEIGHAAAAGAFGLRTLEIALHFFGGYARYAEPPRRPIEEAVISLAGPLVNLSLAGLLYLVIDTYVHGKGFAFIGGQMWLIDDLRYANLILGLFNLLPAFPLDGGTFTRAVLSTWLSRSLARLIVAYAGVVVGFALAAFGLYASLPFTIFLGLIFVYIASTEVTAARRGMDY